MGSIPQLQPVNIDVATPFLRGRQIQAMDRQNRLAELAMRRDEESRQYIQGAMDGDVESQRMLMQSNPELGMNLQQHRMQQQAGIQKQRIELDQKQTEQAAKALWYISQAPEQQQGRLWSDFRDNALPSMSPKIAEALKGQPWDKNVAMMWVAANVPTNQLKELMGQGKDTEFGAPGTYMDPATGKPVIAQFSKTGETKVAQGLTPFSDKTIEVEDKNSPTGYSMVPFTGERVTGISPPKSAKEGKDQSFDQEKKLRDEFQKESKDFVTIRDSFSRIQATRNDPSPYGSISMVYGLMKMFDPNSVVRETEYATAENARGVPENIKATWNKLISGDRLTEEQKQQLVTVAESVYSAQQTNYQRSLNQYNKLAEAYKLDPQKVTGMGGDYISVPKQAGASSQPGGIRKKIPGAGSSDYGSMSNEELIQKAREMGAL